MPRDSYSDLVQQLKDLKPQDPHFGRRLNELISLNELLTTLNTARSVEEMLDVVLLTMLGEHPALRGAIFIKGKTGWRLGIGRGLKQLNFQLEDLPKDNCLVDLPDLVLGSSSEAKESLRPLFEEKAFEVGFPLKNEREVVGICCLSKNLVGELSESKTRHLVNIAKFGGVVLGNHLYRHDLEQMNRQLQRRLFQLNTLYELTGAFSRCFENESVYQILANNLMGQFFISKCVVLEIQDGKYKIAFAKGVRNSASIPLPKESVAPLDSWEKCVCTAEEVTCGGTAAFMKEARMAYALPVFNETSYVGLLLLGPRLDRKPLSEADRDFIVSLSQQAAVAVENVRLQKEMVEKERMERELQLAREIQQKLLPKTVPVVDQYEIGVEMRPYYDVGGDFFDFITLDGGQLSICLADVSGKSLPASMIMSTAQATLRALNSFPYNSPRDVIKKLNMQMCMSTQSNKFVTMFYAVLDPKTNTMEYINAGHNPPILMRGDEKVEFLRDGGMVIGLFPDVEYTVGKVHFQEGTELLIFTDGLSEVMDEDGEEFGDDRLVKAFLGLRGRGSASEAKDELINQVLTFSSGRMVDDLTVMLIRRRAGDGKK